MSTLKVIFIKKRIAGQVIAAFAVLLLMAFFLPRIFGWISWSRAGEDAKFKKGTVVIDPGHGGIDGGANSGDILEKGINLSIAIKLRDILCMHGYKVIMTREEDVSLENLCESNTSRHERDLEARANIINGSDAQLYLSIHVNCFHADPSADGAIVFYNDNLPQNEILAYSIQRAINAINVDGTKQTVHNPRKEDYYLLNNCRIPGVIVETAFISNPRERSLLIDEAFQQTMAEAITNGVREYFIQLDSGLQKDN